MADSNDDYNDWFNDACISGIDWDNNPPPREFLTEELCRVALKGAPENLAKIPDELKTVDVCFTAVYQNDDVLEYVPENLREEVKARKDAISPGQWLDKLSWYGCVGEGYIEKLPKGLLTPEFCFRMVELNGITLEFVPDELRTEELCLEAVKENGMALKYVPEELKTKGAQAFELCLTAMTSDQRYGIALEFVPEALRTAELCLAAVKNDEMFNNDYLESVLQYVPEKLKTAELCFIAVQKNGYEIKLVPKVLLTAELCLAAVKNNGFALEYVPEMLKTAELCLAAVQESRNALRFVPNALRTSMFRRNNP